MKPALRNGSLFAFLTLLAFCLLMANNVLNRHHHFLYKNQVISHAHPFSKTSSEKAPNQPHQHSDFELLIYDLISNSPIVMALVITVNLFMVLLVIFNAPLQPGSVRPICIPTNNSRAPPCLPSGSLPKGD